jgi:outer membrane protein assembly factor BamA
MNHIFSNSIPKVIIFGLLLVLFASCSSNRIINEGDFILAQNKISFKSDFPVDNKAQLKIGLESLFEQEETKSRVWPPSRWFKGDELVIFNEQKTKETAIKMQKFLRNKKGYYHAEVSYKTKLVERKIRVNYIVNTKRRYVVKSIEYVAMDKDIEVVLQQIKDKSYIKKGIALDAEIFDREKARITASLQNLGYAEFVSNFIDLKGDSSDYKVDVIIDIKSPLPDSSHQKFTVGDINVYTDYSAEQEVRTERVEERYNRFFHTHSEDFVVKPLTISRAINFETGELITKDARLETFRNLSNLSSYRFVFLNPVKDLEQDSVINFNILLSPYQKRWLLDLGSDIFYSTISQVGRNLFGFGASASLQNRNLLGGSEVYTVDLESTFEFDLSNFQPNSVSTSLQNNLKLPHNVDLFGIASIFKGLGILSEKRFRSFKDESITEIDFGYTFTSIKDFYRLHSFNASWGYDYQPNQNQRYIIRQIGFDLLSPKMEQRFIEQVINNNPLVRNSFRENLFTGLLLRQFNYIYQGSKNFSGRSTSFIGNFEVSGFENYVINSTVNAFRDKKEFWKLDSIEFSKFIRTEADWRFFKEFSPRSSLAFRSNIAIAIPYGGDTITPYVKQYFVGGPNSLRAWQLRELGPGGYTENILTPIEDTIFYQTGDFKLEFNLEYRFNLFWLIEAAVFLDGGNVWTLRKDPARPRSQLSKDFIDQIALGTGWGLRWDFTYFIMRFDFGYKLRNPFPDPETGSHWALNKKYNKFPFGTVQVAVNYPF